MWSCVIAAFILLGLAFIAPHPVGLIMLCAGVVAFGFGIGIGEWQRNHE